MQVACPRAICKRNVYSVAKTHMQSEEFTRNHHPNIYHKVAVRQMNMLPLPKGIK